MSVWFRRLSWRDQAQTVQRQQAALAEQVRQLQRSPTESWWGGVAAPPHIAD